MMDTNKIEELFI